MQAISLDELYKMLANIYSEQNFGREVSITFGHFVEVCGMLTIHDRKKRRESGVNVPAALCKALGWFFPLLTRLRVNSVEALIYRKYPYACPYCGFAPHRDGECKLVRGTQSTLDHARLRRLHSENAGKRPAGLDEWQRMFQEIYPRAADDRGRSVIGLFEELGEFAEAVRVSEKYPKYFLGEAADVFSWLMGIANEHALRLAQDEGLEFSLEQEFLKRYPGLCLQCGSKICVCPPIPQATVGRMAKELDVDSDGHFVTDPEIFSREGERVAHIALARVGGYEGLTAGLPFDRGDTNHALVKLCLKVADAVDSDQPTFAEKLRAEALRIGTSQAHVGTAQKPLDIGVLLTELSQNWRGLDNEVKYQIRQTDPMVGELGELLDKIRVLFVTCCPSDEARIRVDSEHRAIIGSINAGLNPNKIFLKHLPAATVDDLRRAMLATDFHIIHFSGHSDAEFLSFETSEGVTHPVRLQDLENLIKRYQSVQCVILNSCKSASGLHTPISDITVGMDENISDDVAIEFARGFYDALAAGHTIKFAVDEGISAVRLKGLNAGPITVLKQASA
jgi:NTP pyrophosphatase (non-canonical NTP hydrolase)